MEFTEKQLNNWVRYERVRLGGRINMYDSGTGCRLSGLTDDEYTFCIVNYEALRAAYEANSSVPRV